MAFPTIKVDSTDGAKSDTTCSGAGPATALTGSGNGEFTTTTNFQVPNENFTGVATDGSHVLFHQGGSSQVRRFHKITAVNNAGTGTASVTVAEAGVVEASLDWAIGGVRATVYGTESYKLVRQTTPDASQGWTIEMQDGHAETVASPGRFWVVGDAATGVFTLRGAAGAVTRPTFTFTAGSYGIFTESNYQHFIGFDVVTNYAHAEAVRIDQNNCVAEDVRVIKGTAAPTKAFYCLAGSKLWNCYAEGVATGYEYYGDLRACTAKDCTTRGFYNPTSAEGSLIDCIAANCVIGFEKTSLNEIFIVDRCVFDQNTTVGIRISGTAANNDLFLTNCQITHNGIGIDLTHSSWEDPGKLQQFVYYIKNNNTYSNTTNVQINGDTTSYNDQFGTDHYQPYTETTLATRLSNMDFLVNTSAKEKGYPDMTHSGTGTRYYVDQGPPRQEPAGGVNIIRRTQDALIGR